MAVKTTKKGTAFPEITTMESTDRIPIIDSNGKFERISSANFAATNKLCSIDDVMDNVFIMCHRKRDNYPVAFRPSQWTAEQNNGEVATGVLLIDGGRKLVIAPTETSLYWWSSNSAGGATTTGDRMVAQEDYNGKSNTSKIITTLGSDTGYAPGYCYGYSRVNANGVGLKAGTWWLPSLGELFLMWANFTKINYALSKISGATPLQQNWYWSSTELSVTHAWILGFSVGDQGHGTKATGQARVRAVSAFADAT